MEVETSFKGLSYTSSKVVISKNLEQNGAQSFAKKKFDRK